MLNRFALVSFLSIFFGSSLTLLAFELPEYAEKIKYILQVISLGYSGITILGFTTILVILNLLVNGDDPFKTVSAGRILSKVLQDSDLWFWGLGILIITLLVPLFIFSSVFLLLLCYQFNELIHDRYFAEIKTWRK